MTDQRYCMVSTIFFLNILCYIFNLILTREPPDITAYIQSQNVNERKMCLYDKEVIRGPIHLAHSCRGLYLHHATPVG